jgi:hypothetical protein
MIYDFKYERKILKYKKWVCDIVWHKKNVNWNPSRKIFISKLYRISIFLHLSLIRIRLMIWTSNMSIKFWNIKERSVRFFNNDKIKIWGYKCNIENQPFVFPSPTTFHISIPTPTLTWISPFFPSSYYSTDVFPFIIVMTLRLFFRWHFNRKLFKIKQFLNQKFKFKNLKNN